MDAKQLKAEVAFGDYRVMVKRSVDGLWKQYVEAKRDGKDVPTTHRPTLYAWAKEGKWEERCLVEHRQMQDEERERVAGIRSSASARVWAMVPTAIETLAELLGPEYDAGQRRLAAQTILGYAGFVTQSRTTAAKQQLADDEAHNTPQRLTIARPADDASADEWIAYNVSVLEEE